MTLWGLHTGCSVDIKHSQACWPAAEGGGLVVRDDGDRASLVVVLKHAPPLRVCDSRTVSINVTTPYDVGVVREKNMAEEQGWRRGKWRPECKGRWQGRGDGDPCQQQVQPYQFPHLLG